MNVDKKENEEYNKENKVEEDLDDDVNPEVDMQFNKNQKNFFRAQKDIQEGINFYNRYIEPQEKEEDDNENEEKNEQKNDIRISSDTQNNNTPKISFTEIYKYFDNNHK